MALSMLLFQGGGMPSLDMIILGVLIVLAVILGIIVINKRRARG
ncbi:MAG TPA: hypothetical protein VNM72_06825 [Blastocatellia bacterium]|nr:hypothetical protein [Blastocatellia bacterium]